MLTLFSNPRPFRGIFDTIQRNAIRSWLALRPQCEVILFNDEDGTCVQVAEEFGVRCVTNVAANEFGTPVFSDVFAKVRNLARHEVIGQVNTDVILLNDFVEAVGRLRTTWGERPFLMVGRRWDLDVEGAIEFDVAGRQGLLERVQQQGALHGRAGMDYWVFPRALDLQPPPFAVGRYGIDSWLVYRARTLTIPVVDATEVVTAVHQNHSRPRGRDPSYDVETERNLELAGGLSHLASLLEADWILTPVGLQKPPFPRRIFSGLALFYPWRRLLAVKRRLQRLLQSKRQLGNQGNA